MDNASLPYLKQIAEALKKYSGASGSSTSISGITVSGGGSDSGEVAKSLETGLFAETEGAQGTVSKSAIELSAGGYVDFHYAGWGDPVGTIQITDISGCAVNTPINLIIANLPR